jgi:hypothetical protein
MSTAGALFGLASKWIPNDGVYIFVAISIFVFFGFALAFFVQGKLLEIGAIKSSLLLSLVLSITYPMNSDSLHQLETKRLYLEIDSKYNFYKSEYVKNNPKPIDALEKKKNALEMKKNELAIKYDNIKFALKDAIQKERERVARVYMEAKRSGKYGSWWTKEGSRSNCLHIGNNRLARIECLSVYNLSLKDNRLEIVKNEIEENNKKLTFAITALEEAKKNNSNKNAISKMYKAKMDKIEQEAENRATNYWTIVLFLWGVGLFVEGILSFPLLLLWLKENSKKKTIEDKVKKAEKRLKEISDETSKVLYNKEALEYLQEYAMGRGGDLRKIVTWKKGGRGCRVGQPIALANSLIGAILYAVSLKKNGKAIETFRDVTERDILFVNGRNGSEIIGNKKRMKIIDSFFSEILKQDIQTLGSRADQIWVKDFGKIIPQRVALEHLIKKEEESDIYSPQNLTKESINALAYDLMLKYYPNNYKQ